MGSQLKAVWARLGCVLGVEKCEVEGKNGTFFQCESGTSTNLSKLNTNTFPTQKRKKRGQAFEKGTRSLARKFRKLTRLCLKSDYSFILTDIP